ncbi:MAG: prepilin-type N-terminal cleavage/methylation domain-containing protein [Peptococcaceae bacterium]|nr:prepilin-type N-terminal cleavage/methylation domain-containing protein [Peptococcaceae bacterium]
MKRLLRLIRRQARNEKGFTLIELMVVVIILGILAAIAVPRFIGQTDTAKQKAALAELASIKTAIEIYYAENSTLPFSGNHTLTDELTNSGIDNPIDPWGGSYHYDTSGDSYVVYCQDPDGHYYFISDNCSPYGPYGDEPQPGASRPPTSGI